MTVGDRIKTRRKELGLSAERIAELAKVSPATIYRYESGEIKSPKSSVLRLIARALGMDLYDLIEWDTTVVIDDAENEEKKIQNLIPVKRVKVPLLGSIAAGEPILAEQQYDTYVEAESDVHCDYALRVDGDSMEPTIRLGDLVFIRRQDDVDDGEIAAVLTNDSARLKRVYHIPNGLMLTSDNAAKYPPCQVTYPEYDTIRILGKAVAFKRLL